MRIINPKRLSYYNSVVEQFNDLSKPMTAGMAFGFSDDKYTWLADFLFKHNGNTFINKHTGYVSFFSDKHMMYHEYKNVTAVTDVYPFFTSDKYSPHTYELTTKQYRRVSQNYAEYDLIELINKSDLLSMDIEETEIQINHWSGRYPVYKAFGCRCDMEHASMPGYWIYMWGKEYSIVSQLFEDYFTMIVPAAVQGYLGIVGDELVSTISQSDISHVQKLVDYKIALDIKSPYRGEQYSYDDVVCGTNDYDPQVPFVTFVTSQWYNIYPTYNLDDGRNVFSFYPEIKDAGRVIPKKIYSYFTGHDPSDPIKMLINPGVHLKEADDQSRFSFSACKYMFMQSEHEIGTKYALKTMDLYDEDLIMTEGIDIDTERNRRHSAVVMTQPYMVTKPIADGQIIDFRFINSDGEPIKYDNISQFYRWPGMLLQIKAPYPFIVELDEKLNEREYNDDIIHTVKIQTPDPDKFLSSDIFYDDFSRYMMVARQDACLDDLINGVVGIGKRKVFWIPDLATTGLYNDDQMKVAGMGFGTENLPDGNWAHFVNIYCSNYTPVSSYAPGDTEPIPNSVSQLCTYTAYDKVSEGELFRPMLKLPGINGYIKILQRSSAFKVSKATDGEYVVTYIVEFPFCPGSASERAVMDFTGGYKKTQVYCKHSYIKAGSHKLYGDVYDSDNDRHIYIGDNSFTFSTINLNPADYSDVEYDGFVYPAHLITHEKPFDFLGLIRPKENEFNYMGTYTMELNLDTNSDPIPAHMSHDVRLNILADNRVWKFGEQYSSYIARENPTYIADIDISTLREEFNHKLFNGVPDVKRWVYAYFSGFADMSYPEYDRYTLYEIGDIVSYNNVLYMCTESVVNGSPPSEEGPWKLVADINKSDIVIELWNDESWQPLNPISTDTEKIGDRVLYDNLFIVDGSPNDEGNGITSFVIADSQYNTSPHPFDFPDFIMSSIGEWSNVVLKYDDNYSYHIIYAEPYESAKIKLYVKKSLSDLQNELFNEETVLDTTDLPTDPYTSVLSVCDPKFMISDNQNFLITSCEKYKTSYITKYLDLNDLETTSFRIRIARKKEFPADGTVMQYIGKRAIVDPVHGDNPWWVDGAFEKAFSYKKINVQESVKNFGMTYFKVASK